MHNKRILSIFLSFLIILSSIGINVYADETKPTEEPVSYVEQTEGETTETGNEEETPAPLPSEDTAEEVTEKEEPVIEATETEEEKQKEELPAETEIAETPEPADTQETPVPEIIVEETPVPTEETTAEVTEAPSESELPSETEGSLESPEPTLLPEETEEPEEETLEVSEEDLPLLSAAPLAVSEAPLLTATGTEGEAYAILVTEGSNEGDFVFFRSNE